MKEGNANPQMADVECLNATILDIDLEAVEIEVLDQRLELALAALFGSSSTEPGDPVATSCSQNVCSSYDGEVG